MFARVCSRKMMGPSHASEFLATTKVCIQLWSSLNRCLGQLSQRGYNRWPKGHENPPVQPTIHLAGVKQQPPMHQLRMRPLKPFWGRTINTSSLPKVIGFFHLFFAPKIFPPTYLPPSHLPLLLTFPPSYLPPNFALTPSPKLESCQSKSGSKVSALEARARVGADPARLKLEQEREQSRA
jgi:hypothetical protein